MLVRDWMSTNVITVQPKDNMQKAIDLSMEYKISMLPVLDNGKLVGVVTDRDLKRAAPSHVALLEVKQILYHVRRVEVEAIMTRTPITVRDDATAEEVAQLLLKNSISGCPVMDSENRVMGVVTKNDLFKAMISATGLQKRGVSYGFLLEDRPGSIKEVTDVIRKYGGRLVSIMSSYDKAPGGYRFAHIRAFNEEDRTMQGLTEELKETATMLYFVDHRQNTREIYSSCSEAKQYVQLGAIAFGDG